MRVVVTGAFGYLGLALLRHLCDAGHYVVAVGRAPKKSAALAAVPGIVARVEGDARDLPRLVFDGADAVVHLAGGDGPAGGIVDPIGALGDNVLSALSVAARAQAAGITQLILASSVYVYAPQELAITEDDTLGPDTVYGALKVAAEAVWRAHGGVVMRFASIYGAGCGVDLGRDGVVERLARAALFGEAFHIHGTGEQQFDLVHDDDACAAILAVMHMPAPPVTVNIGGSPTSVIELVAAARRAVPDTQMEVEHVPAPPRIPVPGRLLDVSRARRALRWCPRITLDDGVRGVVDMVRRDTARRGLP